jgi:hypothetical protein
LISLKINLFEGNVVAGAGMLSAFNLNAIEDAGLPFIVGSRMTRAPLPSRHLDILPAGSLVLLTRCHFPGETSRTTSPRAGEAVDQSVEAGGSQDRGEDVDADGVVRFFIFKPPRPGRSARAERNSGSGSGAARERSSDAPQLHLSPIIAQRR